MIDVPPRAGAARSARGGTGVLSPERPNLGAVALDLCFCRNRQENGGHTEDWG